MTSVGAPGPPHPVQGPGQSRRALVERRCRPALVRPQRAAAMGLAAGLGLVAFMASPGGGSSTGGPVAAAHAAVMADQVGDGPGPPPCRTDPGAGPLATGGAAAGAAAVGASALGCTAPSWQALPPTHLESTDLEQLLAQVTREQAVEPREYQPDDLVLFRGGPYQLREEVAGQLERLMAAAEDAGHPHLVVTSGFRSYEVQAGTFQDWAGRMGSEERAERLSARPGHSEHQLGLAVDLAGECAYQCFGTAEDGLWVAENAHRWGFIIRYPEDGEDVTGYAWEPWHLRYVGPRSAWGMHLAGEEYWENFQPVAVEAAGLGG